jgi:hemoglobin-like flavoprotein
MKKSALFVLLLQLLFTVFLPAQTTKEEVLNDLRNAGGLYCPYYYAPAALTPAPEGYAPFYISHYGRHGSRWVISSGCYTIPGQIFEEAFKAGKLTGLGKNLYERMKIAAEDAADRYGDLSSLGAKEHRGIAERMFKAYPEVFASGNERKPFIYSRSTQVPRCILSMAAFDERLKEMNPAIEIKKDASKRDVYLNNEAKLNRDTTKALVADFIKRHFNPDRFINSLFNDKAYAEKNVKDPAALAFMVFKAAINMPNLEHLKINMMDVFTNDEIFVFWQAGNLSMYSDVGPSSINGAAAMKSASLLLKDILDCADSAIKNNNIAADLRFGHDSYIIPLLALMDIKNMNVTEPDPDKVYTAWSDFKASPMGANLQLIFFKNKTNDIIVKVLHCEKETEIPVKTDIAPYYRWKDFKAYYEKKISQ